MPSTAVGFVAIDWSNCAFKWGKMMLNEIIRRIKLTDFMGAPLRDKNE
tara:strand:+ start:717 stop:860 length:144 start_codon:yes stop_codon:yes gene_type:complete